MTITAFNDATQVPHPLAGLHPTMTIEELDALRDGLTPTTREDVAALLASAWYLGLKKSQRAAYASLWHHWLARGSNQHKRVIRADTPRYRAELEALRD